MEYTGDVPVLVADNDLTGYSATVSVVEVGTITVEFRYNVKGCVF